MDKILKFKKNIKGFSLVELIVVIAIMVILIALLTPSIVGYIEKANNAADVSNAKTISSYLQLGLALAQNNSLDYTQTPWTGDRNSLYHGYIYVDDDEIRTSSMVIAEILEENGILKPGATQNVHMRQGKEPQFSKDKVNILCQSKYTWDRYQINFVGKGRALQFNYSACRKGKNKDSEASGKFAGMIGGQSSGNEITLGGKT